MEKRNAPRIATSNFLGYICLDEYGREISEGYGWTTNLSCSGIQMETYRVIESHMVLLLAIDLKEQLIELKGEVVYCKPNENEKYLYGIRFFDNEKKQKEMILNFVKSYHIRDKEMINKMDKSIIKKSGKKVRKKSPK